jgi:Flp pilus assembly protein CpaB
MKSSKLSYIIIVILAALVSFGTWSYLSQAKTTIYLFKDNYSAGTKITPDILVEQQIETKIVDQLKLQNMGSGGAVYITKDNINQIEGDFLKGDVIKGTPLMSTNSNQIGGSPAEARLAENMVAVTIPVDNIKGAHPKLEAGSRVNVYTGYQLDNNKGIEKIQLQNIKVLDVLYSETMNESTKTPMLSGLTLEVTPEQSVQLQFAVEFGKVSVGIVKAGHYKEVTIPDYSMENMKDKAPAASN